MIIFNICVGGERKKGQRISLGIHGDWACTHEREIKR